MIPTLTETEVVTAEALIALISEHLLADAQSGVSEAKYVLLVAKVSGYLRRHVELAKKEQP